MVALKWEDLDASASPLPSLTIATQYEGRGTKTHAVKVVPVHPALGALLASWRAHTGAGADDPIIPRAGAKLLGSGDAQGLLDADLAALGLRRRKGHDFRASFLTALSEAGADESIARLLTHPAPRDVFGGYVRGKHWSRKCEAIGLIKLVGYSPATVGPNVTGSLGASVKTVLPHCLAPRNHVAFRVELALACLVGALVAGPGRG